MSALGLLRLADAAVSSIIATVKAASTPAAATDTALVVDPRPGGLLSVVVDNCTATLTSILSVAPRAFFHTNPTVRTTGQHGPLEADANGNLLVSLGTNLAGEDSSNNCFAMVNKPVATATFNYSLDMSAALEASTVTKAASGNMYGIFGRIDSTAPSNTYYIQAINAGSVPANGAVTLLMAPHKVQHINGYDTSISLPIPNGIYGSTGLVVCLSTSEFTKTLAGAYMSLNVQYL